MRLHHQLYVILLIVPFHGAAQKSEDNLEVFGFIMLDAGYNFNTIDPDWFDAMRPTKLPSYRNQFGPYGNVYFSIRQTRLGIRTSTRTALGELKTTFFFDLYGFGASAGQTTFHLINAFAELGRISVGQTPSVFMDTDAVPVTLDYWGPCSRTFNFNLQFRYTAIDTQKEKLAFAVERPGATADGTDYRTHLDMEQVYARFGLPNVTMQYKRFTPWGHVQAGGLLKLMKWEDLSDTTAYNLSGQDLGWGMDISAVVRANKWLTFKMQALQGQGIQSYVADAPADVGLERNDDPAQPFIGKALPVWGLYLFTEYKWSNSISGTAGYACETVENSNLQTPSAFRRGQYGLVNLRYYPAENVLVGIEYQFGQRENHSDGFHSMANKFQLSFKINFASIHYKN
jgi:hypothetical protein